MQTSQIDVAVDLRRAADDIELATEQIPRVAEIARKIEQGEGLLQALDELARLLSAAKFVAYVIMRHQPPRHGSHRYRRSPPRIGP
jgi:hypothetical protein